MQAGHNSKSRACLFVVRQARNAGNADFYVDALRVFPRLSAIFCSFRPESAVREPELARNRVMSAAQAGIRSALSGTRLPEGPAAPGVRDVPAIRHRLQPVVIDGARDDPLGYPHRRSFQGQRARPPNAEAWPIDPRASLHLKRALVARSSSSA